MGLTPLDGLIMGTRSGSIDPSIIKFIMDETGMKIDDIDNELNKKSGLLGVCGKNDFRDMLALKLDGDKLGMLAYDMFRDSIVKYIADYYFKLDGNVDAIVFTAGVLENNIKIREDIIKCLSNPMGIKVNTNMNNNIGYGYELDMGVITDSDSKIPVYVVPTNEEVMILRDTYEIVKSR